MTSSFTNHRPRADDVWGIDAKDAMISSTTPFGNLHSNNQSLLMAPTKSSRTYKIKNS